MTAHAQALCERGYAVLPEVLGAADDFTACAAVPRPPWLNRDLALPEQ